MLMFSSATHFKKSCRGKSKVKLATAVFHFDTKNAVSQS